MLPTLPKLKGLKGLPKIPHAGKLPVLGGLESKPPRLEPSTITVTELPFEQKYAKYGIFNSSYEVYIWNWLNEQGYQRAHAWRLQVTFGPSSRLYGGWTRVDFLSDILQIAWFPDGEYFHAGETKTAHDTLLRAQVGAKGYRVVQWLIPSSEYLVRELPSFYLKMVHGRL